jgi:hypothetical protein
LTGAPDALGGGPPPQVRNQATPDLEVTGVGVPRRDGRLDTPVLRARAAVDRYDRTGEVRQIREAMPLWATVTRSSQPGPQDSTASTWWVEAASALILYAEAARVPELLGQASELLRQVIRVETDPAVAGAAYCNLGCALECAYRYSGGRLELDQAIDSFGSAGASARGGDGRTHRAPDSFGSAGASARDGDGRIRWAVEVAARHNIASALATRYARAGRLDDLQEAVRWIGLAADTAGAMPSDRARHHLLIPAVPGRALLLATGSAAPENLPAAAFEARLHGSLTAAVVYTTAARRQKGRHRGRGRHQGPPRGIPGSG